MDPGNGAVLKTALPSIIIVATPPFSWACRIDCLNSLIHQKPASFCKF